MLRKSFSHFLRAAFFTTILVLLAIVVLRLLDVSTGDFVDWVVALLSAWWLTLVTTVPWNVYFEARETLAEARVSQERGIPVDTARAEEIRVLAHRALWLALFLHVATAAGLYGVAWAGISPVGYIGAGAAAVLTGLRPSARGYEYLVGQLRAFRKEVRFPRVDVLALRRRVDALEEMLDLDAETSWATRIREALQEVRERHDGLRVDLQHLEAANAKAHEHFEQEYSEALARIAEDRRLFDNFREILHLVKTT